jgi:hypothetical protein
MSKVPNKEKADQNNTANLLFLQAERNFNG